MSQKGQTPDEKFMIAFYQVAKSKGDLFRPLAILPVAKSLNQKETATKNIIKHLAQANFLKKISETQVSLTEHGCKFVCHLLEERD